MIINKEISPARDLISERNEAVSVIAPFNNPTAGIFVMKTRVCKSCKKGLPATPDYFYRSNNWLRGVCKECEKEKSRAIFKAKKCAYCGKEFMPKSRVSKFCCRECSNKNYSEKRYNKPFYKKCAVCGKWFKPYTSLMKFCSSNCRFESEKLKRSQDRRWDESQIEKRMGKNNPGYRNGNYTRNVKKPTEGQREFQKNRDEIKAEMMDSLGYIYCEFCGTSNSPRFEAHHIVYRSEKPGHPKLHCKRNILITCIECHNNLHKQKDLRNRIVAKRKLTKIFGHDILMYKAHL